MAERKLVFSTRQSCQYAFTYILLMLTCSLCIIGCQTLKNESAAPDYFNPQSLGLWQVTEFGTQGQISVQDGQYIIGMGNDMSGITWTGPVLTMDYEVSLQAKRIEGNDFFCGLTIPYNDTCCTLIVGGWSGSVVGISSINGYDAANNETGTPIQFEQNQWYSIRIRVTNNRILVWIDDEQVIDLDTMGKELSVRSEVELSKPLGIATYRTTAAIRNITMTPIVSK